MITHDDIKIIGISKPEWIALLENQKKSFIPGGSSGIYGQRDPHQRRMDQAIMHLGEYAVAKHVLGDEQEYWRAREIRNANPNLGDDGYDYVGYLIDTKTSLLKEGADPLSLNLWVQKHEHAKHTRVGSGGNWDTAYVQCLVPRTTLVYALDQDEQNWEFPIPVLITGWLAARELPLVLTEFGPRYGMPIREITPMREFNPKGFVRTN